MHFTSVFAVVAASAISSAFAAPVANADPAPVLSSEDATIVARKVDAAQEAHRADLRQAAHEKFAKQLCYPGYPFYCSPNSVDQFNHLNYVGDADNHGYGVRVNDSGSTTFNYGKTQLGFHPDGTVFYKDTNGDNCDVTHKGGPTGAGCDEYLYLTNGGGPVFPGTVDQCVHYGINC
ncbi:hypothetical protein HII31_07539 [Pseudocercospora fuligena]|uniref:Uncharacterized protein n=1 Tax=Pseudocercospora fuligena TaxID=685502 RepID=A0A8H6RHP1_9PEZI|nr:hypothetical protein HII31_07539 [Pseudocercospora fuligena]